MSDGFLMAGLTSEAALSALVGLVAGAGGGLWAAWQRTKAFKAEWTRARQDVRVTTAIELIRDLSMELARLSHEMSWLTWRALHDPSRLGAKEVDAWEHNTHELLPKTLGMLAALHAFSPRSCHKIEGATDAILSLASDLSRAAIPVRNELPAQEARHAGLAELHSRTHSCIKRVRDDVGGAAAAVLDDLQGSENAALPSTKRLAGNER